MSKVKIHKPSEPIKTYDLDFGLNNDNINNELRLSHRSFKIKRNKILKIELLALTYTMEAIKHVIDNTDEIYITFFNAHEITDVINFDVELDTYKAKFDDEGMLVYTLYFKIK